jgi:hypothetical protein
MQQRLVSGSEYIAWLNQPIIDEYDEERVDYELSPNTIQQYTYPNSNNTDSIDTIINTNKSIVVTGKPTYGTTMKNKQKKKKIAKQHQHSPETLLLSYDEYMDAVSRVEFQINGFSRSKFELEHVQYLFRAGVMSVVLSFCSMKDLMNLMIVNKQFFKMCSSNYFWKSVYLKRWNRLNSLYNNKSQTKKKNYRQKYILDQRDHEIWEYYKVRELQDLCPDEVNIRSFKDYVLHEEIFPQQSNVFDIHLIQECLHCRSNNIIHVNSPSNDAYYKQCKHCLLVIVMDECPFSLFF